MLFRSFTRNGDPNVALLSPKNRVDADLVQMMSINSEIGNIPFSPEYYPFNSNGVDNAVYVIEQGTQNPTMGVFFSSTTQKPNVKVKN